MKDLVKKQDKFIDEIFTCPGDNTLCYLTGDDKRRIMKLISKVRKETAEAVADRMIGKERDAMSNNIAEIMFGNAGYNERIKEEKELKKQLLEELWQTNNIT